MSIKNLTIPIATEGVARLEDAFAASFGYPDKIPKPDWVFDEEYPEITTAPLITNPETKFQFAARKIKENFIRSTIVNHETNLKKREQAEISRNEMQNLGI